MSKSKSAHTEFTQAVWYLAQVIRAELVSTPTVWANDRAVLDLQVKLAILYSLSDLPDHDPVDAQITGREAVVFVACSGDGDPITTAGRKFVGDARIRIVLGGGPQAFGPGFLKVRFGAPDGVNRFQSIVAWEPIAAAGFAAPRASMVAAGSRKAPAFGLKFDQQGVVTRAKFGSVALTPLCWSGLKFLALRYPEYVKPKPFALEVWPAAGRATPRDEEGSARDLVRQLRPIAHRLGLDFPYARGSPGWKLAERKPSKPRKQSRR